MRLARKTTRIGAMILMTGVLTAPVAHGEDGDSAEAEKPATPAPAPVSLEEEASPEPVTTKNVRTTTGISLLGVSAAAGIAAIVTGSITLSKKYDAIDGCEVDTCDKEKWGPTFDAVKALGVTTDVLIGVTAAGMVTGALLLIIKPRRESSARLHLTPAPLIGGGALTLSGRF